MNFWSKGLGKKTIDLYLSRGESIKSGDTLYVKGQMEPPILWEYIMPMKGEDLEDFLGLLKDPVLTDHIYRSPNRWKIVGTMMWGGIELLGLVVMASFRQALGQVPAEEAIVIEVPPPSVRKKNQKRTPRRRLGSKTLSAPSAGTSKDDEDKAAQASR